jgi:hypothetical protein
MKMILPQVGSEVRVQVHNPMARGQIPPGPETMEYLGRVLDPYRWLTDREFCMTGDAAWPIRVINLGLVRYLEFVSGTGRQVHTATQTWQVKGSRDNEYTVTRTASRWTCTCAGFQFRRNCRHITEISNLAK